MNKVTVENHSSVKKTIQVEIPETKVRDEVEAAFTQLKKNAVIKGFRPGKAPRAVLERTYGKEVRSDVASRLIQESFKEAITETGLNIIAPPRIDPPEIKSGEDFAYKADVEVPPEIADIDYKGMKLKRTLYKVSDQELDTQLKLLQKRLTKLHPITEDRPVQNGDFLLIDYEGFEGEKPSEAAQATENYTMKIGEGAISKTLDEALIGMTKGENRKVEVSFADDYLNKALAGKTITFSVALKEIREEDIPEINDDMAKEVGSYQNIEELKSAISKNLQSGYDKRSEQELNEQIFSTILEKTEFEVPDVLVEMEMAGIIEEAQQAFMYRNMTLEDAGLSIDGLREKYRNTADKQVRRQLILEKIISQEKLEVSDDALKETYREIAQTYQRPVEEIEGFYNENPDKKVPLKHALLEKQAIKIIIGNGQVEEIPFEPSGENEEK